MVSYKFLWFIIGLFAGSFIGFLTSSLLVAADSDDREDDEVEVEFESDGIIRMDRQQMK
ncbi:hypothetical protein [Clostridium magnum]|uniref:Uncharacterized protein n=1 Tax=Clostridium magnum DSM 2767 TaxID=1121326 RepID=A0A162T183_9CLOT|nr:hypothetical protein [Clostridium magnum]KZL92119.1 hypothetical protein CLMAG_19250 [Clostridium magnum DSM 2767]SHH21632.1 hypothetical protein SAMN02745944_00303 [Clostridium magnum DSM 2767]